MLQKMCSNIKIMLKYFYEKFFQEEETNAKAVYIN